MELLDLNEISLQDLQALMAVCSDVAKRSANRFFEDQYWLLVRVAAQRHETLEMAEYDAQHLAEVIGTLKPLVEAAEKFPEKHAGKQFLKFSLTAALNELEKRARRERIKAVD